MRVEVLPLRKQGVRIGNGASRERSWVAGQLASWSYRDSWSGRRITAITVTECGYASGRALLPAIHDVRVLKVKAGGWILAGMEEIETVRKKVERYPQAWAVRFTDSVASDGRPCHEADAFTHYPGSPQAFPVHGE